MKTVNRAVLLGAALFIPLYLMIRFTGGETSKLQQLPDMLGRLKTPLVWHVPEDGVRYLHFFHGEPEPGFKFVLVEVEMEARMKIGHPIVPKCFRLVDDIDTRHFPLARSPLFIERSDQFYLDKDEKFTGELLFHIPEERGAERLLFDRYQE